MNRKNLLQFLLYFIIIVLGISTRFLFLESGIIEIPNFTALGAIALFSANYFKGKSRFLIPIIALWVSDLLLNNLFYQEYFNSFQVLGNLWVYVGILAIVLTGIYLMSKPSWNRLLLSCLGGGFAFYLITNFGVWLDATSVYPKSAGGLIQSYLNGIPFFRNTILANLFYSFLLFGIYEYFSSRYAFLSKRRSLSIE